MVIHLLIPKIEKNMHLFYLQWKIVKRKETVWVSLKKPESQTGRFITLTIPQIRNKYIKESNHNGPKIECNKNWGKFTDQRLKIRDTQKI